ncbi:unnamed protein product [Victoria cruziana]
MSIHCPMVEEARRVPALHSSIRRVVARSFQLNPPLSSELKGALLPSTPLYPLRAGQYSLQQRVCCSNSTAAGQSPTGDLSEERVLESSVEGVLSQRCIVCALLEGLRTTL